MRFAAERVPEEKMMTNHDHGEIESAIAAEDPRAGSSLVPMLVSGLVLVVIGMIVAAALS
jgi:hypothetical protein